MLLQTWIDYETAAKNGQKEKQPEPENNGPVTPLLYFASTSLDLQQVEDSAGQASDIFIGGSCYRRVDPHYFAWLRSRMETAKRGFDSGQLPKKTWDELRSRFNRLQEWAIGYYGKAALQAAMRGFDSVGYAPPSNEQPKPHLFPKFGDWRLTHPVSPESIRKVDAIRERAESLGWTEARLYQNRGRFTFPCGQDWGLVCFVGPGDELGAITESYIEIIHNRHGRRNRLHFNNPEAWRTRQPRESAV